MIATASSELVPAVAPYSAKPTDRAKIPTSQQDAQDTIVRYMQDTISALPKGTSLDGSRYVIGDRITYCEFRVSFPLAAHALNHVQAAVALQSSSPWVAMSSVRVAFEHALTAQWVLCTKDGEDLLAQHMALQDHRRSSEFYDAVVRAAADTPDLAESAALAEEFGEFLGEKPVSDWSVFNLCERFSSTRLLYGIYRDLTQAVHPSYGLVRAHFDITPPPKVVVGPISPFGTELDSPELIRGMAVSSLWALYVLEVSKAGHPDAADVLRLGEENELPVDLRASDLQPHLQPDYEAVFMSTNRRHQPTQD